jgi:sulfur-carrier protein
MMAVNVKIPTPLRGLTGDAALVSADGAATIGEVVSNLEARYPGMRERLLDDTGELRRFVNIYVNGEDVRFLDNLGTPVKDGDEVSIVPAVAGGR